MKNFILLVLFLFSSTVSNAQGMKDVLSRNTRARGGEAVLMNLRSLEADIKMESDKGVIDGKMYVVDQTAYRLEMQIMGQTNYFLVTSQLGEVFFPSQGQKAPSLMTEDQYMTMYHYLDITGPLFNSEQKNIPVEFGGIEKVGEEEATVFLVLDISSPEPTKYYISNENFQLIQTSRTMPTEEGMVEFVTTFSDFKEDKKSGYVYPATIKNNQGTITIKKIKVNEEVPEDLITIQEEKNKEKVSEDSVDTEAIQQERTERERMEMEESQNK